jgi:polyferredoxin
MKIIMIRLSVVCWALTILISASVGISEIFDGEFFGGVGVWLAVFAILAIITLIFSFITTGVLDPRKLLSMLHEEK